MTRDERKNHLMNIKRNGSLTNEERKALRLSIEDLEQEPCDNAISKQAVLNYIYNDLGLGDEENGKDLERQMELESSYRYIKSLPPVIPQPKIGHWIPLGNYDDYGNESSYKCSECGDINTYHDNYCPECGVKMQEVER